MLFPHRADPVRSRLRRWFCLLLVIALLPSARSAAAKPAPAAALLLSAPVTYPAGAAGGAAVWGDLDNDNDQDLLVNGLGSGPAARTFLLRNDGGTLTTVSSGLPAVESSSLALADFDRDGDLDVLITGQRGYQGAGVILGLAGVYRNEGGTFVLHQSLPETYRGWADWGDYDNDGDPDILLTGYRTGGEPHGALFRNDDGVFTRMTGVTIPALGDSYVTWQTLTRMTTWTLPSWAAAPAVCWRRSTAATARAASAARSR